jgi:hypothetical protein
MGRAARLAVSARPGLMPGFVPVTTIGGSVWDSGLSWE